MNKCASMESTQIRCMKRTAFRRAPGFPPRGSWRRSPTDEVESNLQREAAAVICAPSCTSIARASAAGAPPHPPRCARYLPLGGEGFFAAILRRGHVPPRRHHERSNLYNSAQRLSAVTRTPALNAAKCPKTVRCPLTGRRSGCRIRPVSGRRRSAPGQPPGPGRAGQRCG